MEYAVLFEDQKEKHGTSLKDLDLVSKILA